MNSLQSFSSVAVSTPGGMARHFRVQYQTESDGVWHMHATYRNRTVAEASVDDLIRRGLRARLVAYDICASAN